MRSRDNQRQKVYNAESVFRAHVKGRVLTTREAQKLVNQILNRPVWLSMRRSAFPVMVRNNDRFTYLLGQSSHYGGVISLAPKGHIRIVILHELGHSMTTHLFGSRAAWHGPEFVWILRLLIEENMTKAQFRKWEDLALKYGIKWDREAVESRTRFA